MIAADRETELLLPETVTETTETVEEVVAVAMGTETEEVTVEEATPEDTMLVAVALLLEVLIEEQEEEEVTTEVDVIRMAEEEEIESTTATEPAVVLEDREVGRTIRVEDTTEVETETSETVIEELRHPIVMDHHTVTAEVLLGVERVLAVVEEDETAPESEDKHSIIVTITKCTCFKLIFTTFMKQIITQTHHKT